ncbi:MAG: hypothetical protein CMI31_06360 [Opitutae bacterium]|nr:hypothetical protein [Opitutae bacterium]|tara:strand:- start:3451 stop:3882 length:432 start_codon:yes stop_codon:yes gene_type:complete
MIKEIHHGKTLLALLISGRFSKPGITFFTEGSLSQQLAFMQHPVGKTIVPHVHNTVQREVSSTQEVLMLRKGRLRVDFYGDDQNYLESHVMEAGDLILLIQGGHGFEALEEIEMFEVKQGPYAGDSDKTRFEPVSPQDIKIIE